MIFLKNANYKRLSNCLRFLYHGDSHRPSDQRPVETLEDASPGDCSPLDSHQHSSDDGQVSEGVHGNPSDTASQTQVDEAEQTHASVWALK